MDYHYVFLVNFIEEIYGDAKVHDMVFVLVI